MDSNAHDIAVALLYETPRLGAHMRDALAALGTEVVYDEATQAFDREALERSQANVVVVNLDAQDAAGIEEIFDLVGSGRYRFVFNDGDVSSALSGWDHARWLRHLGAKILGGAVDIDPPRPFGAEAVPVPAPRPIPVAVEPANTGAGAAPAAAVASVDIVPDKHDTPPAAATDAHETIDLETLPEPPALADALVAAEPEPVPQATASAAFDLIEFDDEPAEQSAVAAAHDALAVDADRPLDFEIVADADADADVADTLLPFHSDDTLEFIAAADTDSVPAIADASDSVTDEAALDFPGDLRVDMDTGTDADVDAAAEPAASPPVAPEWTLDDLLDPPPAPATPAAAKHFGIETVRAEEFLAPPAAADGGHFAAVTASPLELIPLEEAVAPTPIEAAGRESWLDSPTGTGKIRIEHVWVLGASIGGPESVREFLAAIPHDFPALFIVAQHLGDEFVDMMTQQLAKAAKMTVRTPAHGDRASHGEVLIVPTAQRLLVGRDGVVVLQRDPDEHPYSPSIDRVLHDIADRFGADAGAIVFSGMSDDAVEGCRYLAGKGGPIYAQDPDTCVVSSMVDGARDAGVVTFLGSPRDLAGKLLGEDV